MTFLELMRDYRDVLPTINIPTMVCAGADEKWRTVASVEYAAEPFRMPSSSCLKTVGNFNKAQSPSPPQRF